MRKAILIGLATVVAIGGIVGAVYAIPVAWDYVIPGSNVHLWGASGNNVFIDVDGTVGEIDDECVYFGMVDKAGFFSGLGTVIDGPNHVWEDRAEIAIGRMTQVSGTPTNAWMQSSANAKILAQFDGDIIIILGD